MKVYRKDWSTFIPRPLDEVWHFFSRPENLNDVTPREMKFQILSDVKDVPMYQGMMLLYKVSPILNIPMRWCTEITFIDHGRYFVDEQRFGPYAMWHHEHHFQEVDGGVQMRDLLHYAIPLGPIGRIANALMVNNKIDSIFGYRESAMDDLVEKMKR